MRYITSTGITVYSMGEVEGGGWGGGGEGEREGVRGGGRGERGGEGGGGCILSSP